MTIMWGTRFGLPILACMAALPAMAHNGPPFPLYEGRKVGPAIVALWTHPDVGTGTFFVILDPPAGGRLPDGLKVELGIQPVSRRLPEVKYTAQREDLHGQVQYSTAVNFDADEMWRVRLIITSASGSGEALAQVEATPAGLGRWDLLWYSSPFLAFGALWLRALLKRHPKPGGAST